VVVAAVVGDWGWSMVTATASSIDALTVVMTTIGDIIMSVLTLNLLWTVIMGVVAP